MHNKILHTASEMFITLGVKSVTMDDIAEKMAISKKTIYEFYANKYELIKATTDFIFERVMLEIEGICHKKDENPIKNLFEINEFINDKLQEDSNTEFQLQKYYPDIYDTINEKKFTVVIEGITENLQKGIAQGLYRPDIDIPIVSRFYYNGTTMLKNRNIFPQDQYSFIKLIHQYLVYHIRAIATEKGLKELDRHLNHLYKNKKSSI